MRNMTRGSIGLVTALALLGGAPLPAPASGEAGDARQAPVSRERAFFLSLLLPGLGQQVSGHRARAKFFFGAEAAIWTTSASFKVVSNMRFQSVRQYATLHGGADPNDHTDGYFQLLSDFSSSDVYNISVRDEARARFPSDRDKQSDFIAQQSIQGEHGWHWPDFATQREFQLIRHDALSARRTALLVTGWAVVNRLVSAIEAARSAPQAPETADSSGGFTLEAGVTSYQGSPAARIGFARGF